MALFFSHIFKAAGKSFIALNDGISQHFNTLLYTNRYVHAFLGSIFGKNDIAYPVFNYTLGQGMDVITSLMGYDFLNPICIIAVLLFGKNLFFAYKFVVFTNLFLAGFFFCMFCKVLGKNNGIGIASGAVIYTFCGFAINFCTRHPNFMSGTYFLPLMLISAELFIRKRKYLPLILTVFFSLMTSYYIFYMVFICFVAYLLIRLFPCSKDELKKRLGIFFRTNFVVAVGGLLSAVWLLPSAFGALLNNGGYQTSAGYRDSLFLYPFDYYKNLFEKFIYVAEGLDYKNYLGFFPICLICIIILFASNDKKYKKLRFSFCVGFIGMCIPLVGLVMNGFRFVGNRWTFAFAFIVAFIFVETKDKIGELRLGCIIAILAITILLLLVWFFDGELDKYSFIPFILLTASTALVLLAQMPFFHKKAVTAALFALTIISAAVSIELLYGQRFGNYVKAFCESEDGYDIYTKYSSSYMSYSADDEEFYRVEMQEERENTEGYNNVRGTTFYGSAIDSAYHRYYDDFQLSTCSNYHQILGLGGSAALLGMASVKYFTIPDESKLSYVPFGFEEKSPLVFENKYYLPAAFLYNSYIDYDDFKNRNPVDRQRAMLQGAVLEASPESLSLTPAITSVNEVSYEPNTDNVYLPPGEIYADDGGGTLTLEFDTQPDCELYLWIDGLRYASDESHFTSVIATSGYKDDDTIIEGISKDTLMTTPLHEYYLPRDGVCFNLGYSEHGYNYITVKFEGNCKFGYNGIHVISNPMATYTEDISKLINSACCNITIGKDKIYGTVECDENSILQLCVPYSIGWSAYVDGQKAKLLRSNIMYCALELPPGTHEISMKYNTPYLLMGAVISLVVLIFIVLFHLWKNFSLSGSSIPHKDKRSFEN